MGTYGVPTYKPWDIERIAQAFLSKYWTPGEQWVDVETIIERDLNVLIDYTACSRLTTEGAIAWRKGDRRFVILVSEALADRYPNRYRFTLAQETSHLLLHKDLLESIITAEQALDLHSSLTAQQYHELESAADLCASALLMPQHQFRAAAHDAYELWFERMRSSVGKVIPDLVLKRVIDDLAKVYRVSFQAAKIRLQRWPIKLREDILQSARRADPFIGTGQP